MNLSSLKKKKKTGPVCNFYRPILAVQQILSCSLSILDGPVTFRKTWILAGFLQRKLTSGFDVFAVPVFKEHPHVPGVLQHGVRHEEERPV